MLFVLKQPYVCYYIICMITFKVNNGNTRTICGISSKAPIKTPEWGLNTVLVSSLLTLNIFGTLFWCFHCWLWISKRWIGRFRKFSKTGIAAKSGKVACLVVQKAFKNASFSTETIGLYPNQINLSLKQPKHRI